MTHIVDKIKDFDVVVYHGPCSDGTGGLWACNHYKQIKNHYACKAGINPSEYFHNLNVIFVDICPKIDYLLELVKTASHVVILDHHKSSHQMIKDNKEILDLISNLYIEFDMKRSGCQIAWDYFFDSIPRPFFIDYIGDRDLWTWKLPDSRQINVGLYELDFIDPYDLTKLDGLLEDIESSKNYLKTVGNIITLSNKRQIQICLLTATESIFTHGLNKYRIWLGGNINPGLRSELGNELCLKKFSDDTIPDFSATWQFNPQSDEWWISLRGIEGTSPDLSVIASDHGGGGHPMASGFTIKAPQVLRDIFSY
jgi:oligoribonuclease NrnB/cAMP/cGMP phosphodiesterase (DHH superfamily)